MKRAEGLQPRLPDRLATAARSRRRGGRRARNLRRALAAGLLITAGVLALSDRPGPQPGVHVLAVCGISAPAAPCVRRTSPLAVAQAPDGALRITSEAVGRLLSAPVRKGEVLTDVRLVSGAGPDPGPGRVAVPIRPADPGTVELLTPGVHVAVLAVPESGSATVLAADAVVLSIPPPSRSDPSRRLVVLAVPTPAADRITATAATGTLALRFT